jgi:hypothetical protein
MELLRDMGEVEGRFRLHGDGVNLDEIDARFATNARGHGYCFGCTQSNSLVTWVEWKLIRSVWRLCYLDT